MITYRVLIIPGQNKREVSSIHKALQNASVHQGGSIDMGTVFTRMIHIQVMASGYDNSLKYQDLRPIRGK